MARRSASETCSRCQRSLTEASFPVCEHCGALSELPDDDFFALLGVPRGLEVDESALRERFYALTRQTHPDRYAQSPPAEALRATRWTTAVNRAYQTLRDPERRAYYLLESAGRHDAAKRAPLPLDLAETYFELQDLAPEAGGTEKLAAFRRDLEARLAGTGAEWQRIAAAWNDDEKAALDALAALLVKRKYLGSMLGDIDRRMGVRQ